MFLSSPGGASYLAGAPADTPDAPRTEPVREAPWIVTLPVRYDDGRAGRHCFVEWAAGPDAAICAALLHAAHPVALERRRGGRVSQADGPATTKRWRDHGLAATG
ncbi:hypothetical protein HUT16_00925 [Kitasatospora sp. NA04385]|uniref:hypothetical protein n=1 Tax=Kitasatospora sp. NA04385 TaxID=2742135 RepID=UPI001590443F|nr:hypothetical protein [Kitasatospora sp. NA04385]QKW17812.1 hypothetical protein HUT16_00925 [Kitasatospora sp. NA04385]